MVTCCSSERLGATACSRVGVGLGLLVSVVLGRVAIKLCPLDGHISKYIKLLNDSVLEFAGRFTCVQQGICLLAKPRCSDVSFSLRGLSPSVPPSLWTSALSKVYILVLCITILYHPECKLSPFLSPVGLHSVKAQPQPVLPKLPCGHELKGASVSFPASAHLPFTHPHRFLEHVCSQKDLLPDHLRQPLVFLNPSVCLSVFSFLYQ